MTSGSKFKVKYTKNLYFVLLVIQTPLSFLIEGTLVAYGVEYDEGYISLL